MSGASPAVIAVIPARHASTRLPGKPLADIGGKPMVRHVAERASEASLVGRVVVAADHPAVAAAASAAGVEAVMTPPELPSGTDRIAHVARTIPGEAVVVNVQGDEPFVSGAMIDAAVRPLLEDPAVEAATVAAPLPPGDPAMTDPSVVKVAIALDGNALYFSRSPIPFNRDGGAVPAYRHFGIYAYRKRFLLEFASWAPTPLETAERLEQLRILEHGRAIRVTVGEFESVAVDTPEDLARARKFYKDRFLTEGA